MKTTYVYPGTFSPPTLGHLNIVQQAAQIFPELIILCSENPGKKEVWFSPEECKNLWATYKLPQNVTIMTLAEFKSLTIKKERIVMIRGLRGPQDLESEIEVMLFNEKYFGIKKYFYIFGAKKFKNVSSSKVRQKISSLDLRHLAQSVSPLVISALLEKFLQVKNIFLVVGRPGSGKSTFLKMLNQLNASNYLITTDGFNQQLKPLLKEKFGQEDLIKVALNREVEMKKIIAKSWINLLAESLRLAPAESNIFVEIAYGLQLDKLLFRFVGGKIIYIGCQNESENFQRVVSRGTPELTGFIKKIPDQEETRQMAKKYHLAASYINTSCSLEELYGKAQKVNNLILGGQNHADNL